MVGLSKSPARLSERERKPPVKTVSSSTVYAQNTPQGARPGTGMCRNVTVAPLLAPQPKAREKPSVAGEQHAPPPPPPKEHRHTCVYCCPFYAL